MGSLDNSSHDGGWHKARNRSWSESLIGNVDSGVVCHRVAARARRSGSSIVTYCRSKRAPAYSATARIANLSSGDQQPKSRMTEAPLTRTWWATQIMRPSRMSLRPAASLCPNSGAIHSSGVSRRMPRSSAMRRASVVFRHPAVPPSGTRPGPCPPEELSQARRTRRKRLLPGSLVACYGVVWRRAEATVLRVSLHAMRAVRRRGDLTASPPRLARKCSISQPGASARSMASVFVSSSPVARA
jgi:hypothetical protein